MVACLTPDQKVVCSNHVRVNQMCLSVCHHLSLLLTCVIAAVFMPACGVTQWSYEHGNNTKKDFKASER